MTNKMNKINRRIQEYKDKYHPIGAEFNPPRHLRKRNQAKRLARKLRGVK